MPVVRVALVGGLNLLRHGLRSVIDRELDMAVVGEAATTTEAQRLLERTTTDVVMLDAPLPGRSGLAAARELLQRDGDLNILCMSTQLTEDAVAEGLSLGVLGFISYAQPASDFTTAIRSVSSRKLYLSPMISQFMIDEYRRKERRHTSSRSPLESLSGREREVLKLLVDGLSNVAIAEHLSLSRRTVETHRAHVMKKLHLRSVRDLFRYCAQHGLLEEPPLVALPRSTSDQATTAGDGAEQEQVG